MRDDVPKVCLSHPLSLIPHQMLNVVQYQQRWLTGQRVHDLPHRLNARRARQTQRVPHGIRNEARVR